MSTKGSPSTFFGVEARVDPDSVASAVVKDERVPNLPAREQGLAVPEQHSAGDTSVAWQQK